MDNENDRFMREPEVKRKSGLSRTTRWRLEREGKFPRRRRISVNSVAWLSSEVEAWMAERRETGSVAVAAGPGALDRRSMVREQRP